MATEPWIEDQNAAAAVWVSPGRRSGEACVFGTRIPTLTIAAWVWRDGVESVIEAYPMTRAQVLGTCWYEAVHGAKRWRRRWGKWAAEHHGAMWSDEYDRVPDPPIKERPGAV